MRKVKKYLIILISLISCLFYVVTVNGKDKEYDILDIRYGREENVIAIVRDNSFDYNMRGVGQKDTPLIILTERNYLKAIRILINRGADINGANINGTTPLSTSLDSEDNEIFDFLINNKNIIIDYPDCHRRTPLFYANTYCTEKLIKKGANVNIIDINGDSPLHYAVNNAFYTIDNTEKETEREKSGIRDTCKKIDLLVNADAKVNVQNKKGMTPFHYACFLGVSKIINKLLEHGADPNIKSFDGLTPLMVANNPVLIEGLVKLTKNINDLDNRKRTALDIANEKLTFEKSRKGNITEAQQVVDLLRKHGAKTAEELKAEKKKQPEKSK